MSIAVQPRRFITGRMLDCEDFNENLLAAARDVGENLSRRYTYSQFTVPLAGLVNTDGLGVRSFDIDTVFTGQSFEVIGADMRVCATAGVTWTMTLSGSASSSTVTVTVLTTGATTEALGSAARNAVVTNGTLTGVLSASGASAIVAGEVVVYLRCDRGGQGDSHEVYDPVLYGLSNGVNGTYLDDELDHLQDAVVRDTDNNLDMRCELYMVRNLGSAATVAFQCPSGARRLSSVELFVAADAARSVRLTIGGAVTVATINLAGSGVAVLQGSTEEPTAQSVPNDPTDVADDTVVTLLETTGTGTVAMTYALLWWS